MTDWTILTCEYPPDCGGVGEYTAQVASGLARAGARVTVFHPPAGRAAGTPGVDVRMLPDHYGRAARHALDHHLDQPAPGRRLLVQYVPNAFGLRGANLPFTFWLRSRRRRHGDDVRVMFHEPYFYFGLRHPQRNVLALAQRAMAAAMLRASARTYVATDAWRHYLAPYAPRDWPAPTTLPIPSVIPRADADVAIRVRSRLVKGGGSLVGHVGTFGPLVAPLLDALVGPLLRAEPKVRFLCAGSGSEDFAGRLIARDASLRGRVLATGRLAADDLAAHIRACDVMVQPYPDGVTTRRTSVMASLVNGVATVTTAGPLTEPVWGGSGAVALARVGTPEPLVVRVRELLANQSWRVDLAARGERVYASTFSLDHTLAALLRDEAPF